jgi:two-component system cell cycle sensor histidine kinase/response regulator CckA
LPIGGPFVRPLGSDPGRPSALRSTAVAAAAIGRQTISLEAAADAAFVAGLEGIGQTRECPGKGARFTLLFPKSGEAVETPARTRKLESGLAGTETILLVEDEVPLLALARRSLESYGYHVIPAGNPADAIQLAEAHSGEIALLLTDIVMPGMNGRELYERMNTMRPGIRVVYMSGYPADIVARRGELEKESVYVQKPFTLATLVRSVREALDCDPPLI